MTKAGGKSCKNGKLEEPSEQGWSGLSILKGKKERNQTSLKTHGGERITRGGDSPPELSRSLLSSLLALVPNASYFLCQQRQTCFTKQFSHPPYLAHPGVQDTHRDKQQYDKVTESKINLIRETNLFTAKSPAVLRGEKRRKKKKKREIDYRQAHRLRYTSHS